MSPDYQTALGRKIAFHRKRRGLSQKEFAGLLGRSEAWISQVERGVRRIDRMTVLEKLADALDLPIGELAAEAPVVASTVQAPPDAGRLRLTLSTAHSLQAVLTPQGPPNIPALRAQADHAWALTHDGNYADLTPLLEDLIPHAETAVRAEPEAQRPELYRLLTTAYHTCSAALANLGEHDAAWIAVDRSVTAAERAGDPLLMAAGQFRLAIVFLSARRYDQAARAAGSTADALRPLSESGDLGAVALRGALTLQRAVAAGHTNQADAAYEHIRQAGDMASQVGAGRNDYNTEFGPANVALYEVAVAVNLGDAGRALRTAQQLDPSDLSAERQTRFHLDIAKAHTQRRQITEAISAVRAAQRVSPEIVRNLPVVKQLVADLVTMSQPPTPELHSLAAELDAH